MVSRDGVGIDVTTTGSLLMVVSGDDDGVEVAVLSELSGSKNLVKLEISFSVLVSEDIPDVDSELMVSGDCVGVLVVSNTIGSCILLVASGVGFSVVEEGEKALSVLLEMLALSFIVNGQLVTTREW